MPLLPVMRCYSHLETNVHLFHGCLCNIVVDTLVATLVYKIQSVHFALVPVEGFEMLLAELNAESDPQIPCYVTAPFMIIQKLICRIINDRSSLVIYDGEELVSNVISIQCSDSRIKIPFPIRIAIPFTASYRGHYREIMVKVSDGSLCSSYMSPISLEGIYDGHKGTYAEIKVYKLGIFSVVSCLKKERFTVPKKGLALKLSMDGRIALNYLPGTFSAPVIVQSKVQPIDTTLLSTLKARQDVYHSIVSTSPIVHITHPSTQQFRKSIAIIVPCPPNPDKKRLGDETDHGRAATAMVHRSSSHRIRAPVKKHGEPANESLKLLGFKCRDEQWFLMDAITVKNGQNGLVEFEIAEHVERFIVLRLSSSVDSSYLVSFIQELEEAIQFTMVNIVMYHRRDNFHKAVVQLVPSKDSPWELAKLREKGYRGPPEPSEEFPMREGEQLILKFSGNIKSLGNEGDVTQGYQLIFHSQRKTRLELELNEVDEFGNYCSPHYKGMAIFYKVTKEELTKQWDGADNAVESQQRMSDNVLYWVASELSEEDALLLFTSLRIRRSAIQLVKLTNPDDLTHQIFKLLSMWKKSLPTSADKQRLLSRHLNKCSRQDLVEDLQSKWKIGEEK
uniref:Death domain containing 1 n=1 Tax=Callorhinchus milii TaxID=7868 RepID=A0A4W3IG00_CALMI